jgi:hypothetical protein
MVVSCLEVSRLAKHSGALKGSDGLIEYGNNVFVECAAALLFVWEYDGVPDGI